MRVPAAQEATQQVPSGGYKADRPLPVAATACAQARREAGFRVVGVYSRFLWQGPELEAGGGRVWAGAESPTGSRRLGDPVSELKPGDCTQAGKADGGQVRVGGSPGLQGARWVSETEGSEAGGLARRLLPENQAGANGVGWAVQRG